MKKINILMMLLFTLSVSSVFGCADCWGKGDEQVQDYINKKMRGYKGTSDDPELGAAAEQAVCDFRKGNDNCKPKK